LEKDWFKALIFNKFIIQSNLKNLIIQQSNKFEIIPKNKNEVIDREYLEKKYESMLLNKVK